ncbi:MAG: sulfotransferase [Ignavibacteriae bacterium]|nr:sulfotransferase [Ignavibacteriota bacterium]NOH00342.1 sulfotransferase [Ignavibacteriota bacterium]
MRKQDLIDNKLSKKIGLPIITACGNLFKNEIKNPVFLIGLGRSGTTKLLHILSKHNDIAAFPVEGNMYWHPKSYPWIETDLSRPPFWFDPHKFTSLSVSDWTPYYEKRLKSVFGAYKFLFRRKKIFLNKNVMLNFMIPKILELFPNAKFINLYRDGRAVAYSYAKHEVAKIKKNENEFRSRNYYSSFEQVLYKMCELWSKSIQEVENMKKNNSTINLFEMSYEDFCSNPKLHLDKVFEFLKIDPSGLDSIHYADVKSMNYKFATELTEEVQENMLKIMTPVLKLKGYLNQDDS